MVSEQKELTYLSVQKVDLASSIISGSEAQSKAK
jgi:hypothetical protein